jgi:hypothetical protein
MPEINWRKEFGLNIEKSWEAKGEDGKQYHYVNGYASDQSLDRDGDRMSGRAIDQMKKHVDEGMNFYADHKHGLFDMLGVLTKAENRNGHLWVEARMEDPELNNLTKLFLHKLDIGEKIGLSIGGDLRKSHMDGPTRVIDDVVLYEISAVGIPSNANAYLLGSVYKNHEFIEKVGTGQPVAMRPGGAMGLAEEDHGKPAEHAASTSRATGGKDVVTDHECSVVHAGITHDDYLSTVKALSAKTEQLLTNMVKDAVRNFGEVTQNMGGTVPDALLHAGDGKDNASGTYPDKDTSAKPPAVTEKPDGMLKMADTNAVGGQQSPPDAGTVPKLEEKPSKKPSTSHPEVAPAGKPGESVSAVVEHAGGTGPSDKGSYSQTDDKDEEDVAKLEDEAKHEDDDEAKKALQTLIAKKRAKINARKAKTEEVKLEDLFAAQSAGKKAEEGLRGLRSKIDDALGAPSAAAPAFAEQGDKPFPGAAPPFGSEEDEAKKEADALKGLTYSIFDKFFPANSPAAADFKKEYESAISSVFSQNSGTQNFLNQRSPGQPEGKIAAEPGKSGSSEVFRTDSGSKGGLETMDDAKKNPPASLDTVAKEPIGTYDTPTKVTSGTGYQMDLLRNAPQSTNKGQIAGRVTEHSSLEPAKRMQKSDFKSISEMEAARLQKEFPRLKPVILPKLKNFDPNRVPTEAEVEELIKSGKLSEDLVNPAPTEKDDFVYVDATGKKRKSVLTKGIVTTFRK